MNISIPIDDWLEEYQRQYVDLTSEAAIFDLLLSKFSTAEVARFVLVARALGKTQEDIIEPDKLLLQSGARAAIANMYKRAKITVTTDAGTELEIRAYVGKLSEDEGDDKLVSAQSQEGVDRAVSYCLNTIAGHTFGRFKIIVVNDPLLLVEVKQQMKAKLDEMVERLLEQLAEPVLV